MLVIKKSWFLLNQKQKKQAVFLFSLMILVSIFELLGIGMILPILSLFTEKSSFQNLSYMEPLLDAMGNPTRIELIIMTVILMLIIFLLKSIFLTYFVYKQNKFTHNVTAELSHKFCKIYLLQPYNFHLVRNSAQLIRNIKGEVGQFINGVLHPLLSLGIEILTFFGIFILLVVVEPIGSSIVVLMFGSISFLFLKLTRKKIAKWGQDRQLHDGMVLQHLQQGFGGIKEIILSGREENFINKFNFHNIKNAYLAQSFDTFKQLPRIGLELLGVMSIGTLILVMVWYEKNLPSILPVIALFVASAFRVIPCINRIVISLHNIRFSKPSINILNEELKLEKNIIKKKFSIIKNKEPLLQKNLQIKNLDFSYSLSGRMVLKNVNLDIVKGEAIGLFGSSGSGKTTLVDIFLGLLKPTNGIIEVDGKNIHGDLENWQSKIGYVPQSIYLTDDTLKRNIAFGIPDNEIDIIKHNLAIKNAQLEEFVESLPNREETFVGERGTRISGGQLQRLGIARALYHDPELLVLDEATSALDNDTEKEVMKVIYDLKGIKTALVISHRFSTIEKCNKLYKLEQGNIKIINKD